MKTLQKTIAILREPAQYSLETVMSALKEIENLSVNKSQAA